MRKPLLTLCAMLAGGGLIAACGSSEKSSSSGGSGPIKIGASLSLTGEFSSSAKLIENGYKFWAEKVNSEGGIDVDGKKRKVDLIIKNDDSDSNTAVQLVDDLISEEKVNLLFAPWGSGETSVVAPITERNHVVMIAPEAAADEIWEHGYKWLFGIEPLATVLMDPIIDEAKERGIKKVAIVAPNETFPLADAAGAKKRAEEDGMEVVADETYPAATTEDGSLVSRLQSKDPEMIINPANTEAAVLFVRTLYQRQFIPKLVALQGVLVEESFLKALGKEAEGLTGDQPWVPSLKYTSSLFGTTAQYNAAYKAKYGEETSVHSATSTSTGEVLQQAIEAAKSVEPEKVREELEKMTFHTVFGPVKFDSDGVDSIASPYTVQRQGEELPIVAPSKDATAKLKFISELTK